MGYRIVYGGKPVGWSRLHMRMGSVLGYTGVCLILFGLLTAKFWPRGREVLQDVFLPGDPAVTRQALGNMAENLKDGEAFGDAVAAFCREIVNGAELAN